MLEVIDGLVSFTGSVVCAFAVAWGVSEWTERRTASDEAAARVFWVAFPAALVGLLVLLWAGTARAQEFPQGVPLGVTAEPDKVSIKGTTIRLQRGTHAPYEVVIFNRRTNNYRDNGAYDLQLDGLHVPFTFFWNPAQQDGDQITVTPPPGYSCIPAECAVVAAEESKTTIELHFTSVGF